MRAPIPIQIGGILIAGLLLSQLLQGSWLAGLLPILAILLWTAAVAGVIHTQGWTWLPAVGAMVDRTPPLRGALDVLVGAAGRRPATSTRASGAAAAAAAAPAAKPAKVDPVKLERAIREAVSTNLLGQNEVGARLAAITAMALDPKSVTGRPRLVLVAGGSGSGRSTLLGIAGRSAQAAGAETVMIRLGDTAEAGALAAAVVVLVDDMDRQPPQVVEAVSALLRRNEATRLVVLAQLVSLPVQAADRQPEPDPRQVDRMLAPLGGATHADLAALIVPPVPAPETMVNEALTRLAKRCLEHGMQLELEPSKPAIGVAIMLPNRIGGHAVHPGLWIRHLDALCDRELPSLKQATARSVVLAASASRDTVQFRRGN